MKIIEVISQHRRDIRIRLECEHCKEKQTVSGYDDTYYHEKVIPRIKCISCGKVASSDYRPLAPKHPDHVTV